MNLLQCYNKLKEDRFFSFIVPPTGYIDQYSPALTIYNFNAPFAPQSVLHVLPGSFNPLHEAHKSIFDSVSSVSSRNSYKSFYEISIERVGKEDLSFEELLKRLNQFSGYATVWVTRAKYFIEKSALLREFKPNFHIGIDTAKRISEQLGFVGMQGIHGNFYVYPRETKSGSIEDITSFFGNSCPRNFMHADHPRPDLVNLSSTLIRNNQ